MVKQTVRVALLTTSFPLNTDSVSGVFVQRLVKSLPSSVFATVITPGDTSPATIADGYKVHCFRYAPWKWQLLAHQPGGIPVAIRRSMAMRCLLPIFLIAMLMACFRASRKVDIIHANWSVNGAIAGLVGFLLRKPVVTTLRGEDVTRAKNSRLYYYLLVWCLRSNSKLVTVSEAIYDHLSREFPGYSHKIVFLPNGVDSELLNNPIIKSTASEKTIFKLLTVGSLIPRKGIGTIIEALSKLDSKQSFKLLIVGDGVELNHLKDLVKKESLGDVIEFVGQVPPEQVVNYLHDADAFILASYSEGRPNVVLEAFATGVPVIASDIDGVKELVRDGENGMKFQVGNAQSLANKIKELQQSQELQVQFSIKGRDFILQNQLLWENIGQKYAQLYNEVIQN